MSKRRLPNGVVDAVLALAGENGPKAIEAILRDRYGPDGPSIRTINRIIGELPDEGAVWQFKPDEADVEDGAVLDVCSYLVESSEGRHRTMTEGEAEVVRGLRRAAPDLPAPLTWQLTRAYRGRLANHLPTMHLDHFLAFAPWRDRNRAGRYLDAHRAGWIDDVFPWVDMSRPGARRLYEVPPEAAERWSEWWRDRTLAMKARYDAGIKAQEEGPPELGEA
jgi:hypothetical protein